MSTLCSNAKLSTGIVTDQYAHFSACIKNSGTYIACVKRSAKYTKKTCQDISLVRRCEFAYALVVFRKAESINEKMCHIRIG